MKLLHDDINWRIEAGTKFIYIKNKITNESKRYFMGKEFNKDTNWNKKWNDTNTYLTAFTQNFAWE
jgi:hypothetical protein